MNPREPTAADAERFQRDGVVVLKGYFDNVEAFRDTIAETSRRHAGEKVFQRYDRFVSLEEIGFTPEAFASRSYGLRIPEIHALSPELQAMIGACGFERALAALAGGNAGRVDMLQSLYFPFSSNQASHSDKYLVSPPSRGYRRETLLGVWMALDATSLENGALYGWKGSHRVEGKPYFGDYRQYGDYSRDLTATLVNRGLSPAFYNVEAGDVVVWASDFVHGGASPLSPSRTRRALVLHYGCLGED